MKPVSMPSKIETLSPEPILSKKELSDLISDLYKKVSHKQRHVCDGIPEHQIEIKNEVWAKYNEIRDYLKKANNELIRAGGIED